MMPGRGSEWKSRAADSLQRSGRGDAAKELFGTGDRPARPAGEMTAAQLRAEGERRAAAQPEPRRRSLLARLLGWLGG